MRLTQCQKLNPSSATQVTCLEVTKSRDFFCISLELHRAGELSLLFMAGLSWWESNSKDLKSDLLVTCVFSQQEGVLYKTCPKSASKNPFPKVYYFMKGARENMSLSLSFVLSLLMVDLRRWILRNRLGVGLVTYFLLSTRMKAA